MIHYPTWKKIVVAVVCLLGFVLSAPNLLTDKQIAAMPGWIPHQKVNLGLDLRGGSHLLLDVDVSSIFRERLESMVDGIRDALLKEKPRIGYRQLGITGDCAGFTVRNPEDLSRARRAIRNITSNTETTVEGSHLKMCLTRKGRLDIESSAVKQSIEIVRRRIDETGTREPTIQRQGAHRIIVQLPGVKDPEHIKKLLNTEAKLSFHLLDQTNSPVLSCGAGRHPPPGDMCLPSQEQKDSAGNPVEYLVKRRVMVSGDTLVDAQATFQNGEPVVSFRFDPVGARRFGDVTRKNVGQPFAIVLDKKVISAPVIREPILGGNGVISGSFSVQSAQDLALLLRAGALPAPMTVLEERSVGAELGADSIDAGETASVLAVVLVVVFMVAAYGTFGVMADVALLLNLVLIMAAMSLLQATLTLPGIAGIVLTIGMAVDANVLIFERIREEERNGRTPISAVDAGFDRALTTIVDANITTLIAAILLYQFGSGPVRGFAVTLALGIATSMFTAIMVTRYMAVTWLRLRRPKKLPL